MNLTKDKKTSRTTIKDVTNVRSADAGSGLKSGSKVAEESARSLSRLSLKQTSRSVTPLASSIKNRKPRPHTAPSSLHRKPDDMDIISKLMKRNIHEALMKIFLPLDSTTLTASREVCRVWFRYFKAVFWRENRVLKKMKERLFSNWMQKNFQRVSLTIMSGIACRKSCFANSRDCLCGQYIVGQVTEDCFVMEFGGREFVGNYVIQEGSNPYDIEQSTINKDFNIEHFQLKFNLKNELSMELSDWLSSPVIINGCDNKMKTTLIYESYKISKHPSEPNSILIQNAKTKETMRKVILYTESDDEYKTSGIQGILCHTGRLAAIIGGRIHVFDFEKLLNGSSRYGALLLKPKDIDAIHYFYLSANFLLIASRNRVVVYNYWRYKPKSSVQDFIL